MRERQRDRQTDRQTETDKEKDRRVICVIRGKALKVTIWHKGVNCSLILSVLTLYLWCYCVNEDRTMVIASGGVLFC